MIQANDWHWSGTLVEFIVSTEDSMKLDSARLSKNTRYETNEWLKKRVH